MKNSLLLITLIFLTSCAGDNYSKYKSDRILDADQKHLIVYDIIRYAGPLAPRATHESKFNIEFDGDYWKIAREHSLDWLHIDKTDGNVYFGISRIAPSLHRKKVTIAGKFKRDESGEITYYEEVFRTWRMVEDELEKKSGYLFAAMVAGKDLTPYYPENSGDEEYIEFPNQTTFYDVANRRWISTLQNPAQELREQILSQLDNQTNN